MAKPVLIHRVRKRANFTEAMALAFAKSRMWWNVDLIFYPDVDPKWWVWREDPNSDR